MVTLVHLSDLHFTRDLTEAGRRLWLKLGVKSHSFSKINSLAQEFAQLENRKRKIDLVVVTGDVSTDGTHESLSTALEFVRSREIYRDRRLRATGLGVPPSRLIAIPGNHDRFGLLPIQTASHALEEVFEIRTSYPYTVAYDAEPEQSASFPVLFFIFDSTLPPGSGMPMWNKVARGQILEAERRWLMDQPARIELTRTAASVDGSTIEVNFAAAVRIALIHHHPVEVRRGNDQFTKLMDSESFVDACFVAKIDLVLFGHEHVDHSSSMQREGHTVYFIACPSTSEYSSENGFNIINLTKDRFVLETYRWDKKIRGFAGGTTPEKPLARRDSSRHSRAAGSALS